MKKYQPCEVTIRLFVAEDVIKTSQTLVNGGKNGVTTDSFTNENWWNGGGSAS